MTITVSTDGSALGNPNGPMGWAWADHEAHAGGQPGHEHPGDCDAGGATNGTNQIGELCAVLEALRAHPGSEPLVIETDSQYAINCSTKWVHGWKKNGWKNAQKKPVKNMAVIKAIDAELSRRAGSVRFVWVKGHAGNAGNEKVDELARTYAEDCRSGARDGYLPSEGWRSLLDSEYSKGTDVPADAQLLMDGAISEAEYHLGRGDDSAGSGLGTGGAAATKPSSAGQGTKPTAARRAAAGGTSGSVSSSIADLLAEPEGAPGDLADFGPRPESGEERTAASTADAPAGRASMPTSAPGTAVPATPADTAPAGRANGLSVSGTLRFTPPPSSSPTYDGRPRLIRGVIAVEGYVNGDGTITLDQVPFTVSRG